MRIPTDKNIKIIIFGKLNKKNNIRPGSTKAVPSIFSIIFVIFIVQSIGMAKIQIFITYIFLFSFV